ncbi:hypothetical protein D3C73_953980 [compost metagenome]
MSLKFSPIAFIVPISFISSSRAVMIVNLIQIKATKIKRILTTKSINTVTISVKALIRNIIE